MLDLHMIDVFHRLNSRLISSTSLKVLIEVDAGLTEGDYEFSIKKNGRKVNRLLIQDETLVAEYVYEFSLFQLTIKSYFS